MDVQALRRALTYLCELDPRAQAAPRTASSQAGLARLEGGHCIEHSIAAESDAKGHKKPGAAYEAQRQRDAVLRLAVVHELMLIACSAMPAERGDFLSLVAQRAFNGAMGSSTIGLQPAQRRPRADPSDRDQDRAKNLTAFLVEMLPRTIGRIEHAFGIDLLAPLDDRHRADDRSAANAWHQAWTCAIALAPMDWLRVRGCTHIAHVARALWNATGPDGTHLKRFKSGEPSPLPTGGIEVGESRMQLTPALRLQPLLVQMLEGRDCAVEALADEACLIHLPLKSIDYKAVRGEVFYMGRSIFDLYLAVLAGCLLEARRDEPAPKVDVAVLRALWESAPTDPLPAVERSALGQMREESVKRRDTSPAPADPDAARDDSKRVPKHRPRSGLLPVPQAIPGVPSRWLAPSDLKLEVAFGERGPEGAVIATLELWPSLGAEHLWVEHHWVAFAGGQEVPLPIIVRDAEGEAGSASTERGCRSECVLRSSPRPCPTPDELRRALQSRGNVSCLVTQAGTGALVVVGVRMPSDAQPGAGEEPRDAGNRTCHLPAVGQ